MDSLGPYELRAALGQGGGGEVYRAWDPRLEREVALKILHARFGADPERIRSFVAEARAASALNHPNIVTVFDVAINGGTPYIVSELIDGRPLREEMARGPVPLKRLLDLATQIADGLSAAHDAGIKHGDLKPENIMVTRTGRAKIVDFGLTRAVGFSSASADAPADPGVTQTMAGLVAGTIPYMSPEQARGLPTDPRSDQFAFGLILSEMVTGRPAFRRQTPAETLDAIIHEEPPSISPGDLRAPVLLKWIIDRCLAKDPAERYNSTADLHRDLRTIRDHLGEITAPAGGAGALSRGRSVSLIAIAAVLFSAAGAWLSGFLRDPAQPDFSRLSFIPLITDPGYQGLPAWSPNGQAIAYSADVNGKLQIFTRKIGSSESLQLTHQAYDCTHPFWSEDGQRVYFISLARQSDGIWSVGAAGGRSQLVVENASRGAVSRDGRTLAFLRDEARADIIGTAALWISTPAGNAPWAPDAVEAAAKRRGSFGGLHFIEGALAFSPDGTKLGLCVIPGPEAESGWQFWIMPLPDGSEVRRLESWSEPAPRISNFTWLPDSRHIVLGVKSLRTPGSQLWMADLDRNSVWPLSRGSESASYPSASAAGDQVVFTSGEPDYDVVEIALATGEIRPVLTTARNESDPVYSPDGRQFAYVTDRRGPDEIWIRTRTGQVTDSPIIDQSDFGDDPTQMLGSPGFSPDGERLAYQRNGYKPRLLLRIWWTSATTDGPSMSLMPPTHSAIQSAPAWSPDGQWIAYAEWRDKQWQLVKAPVGTGEAPQVLRKDGVSNATPRWSRTGWITWETSEGFRLVSADGKIDRPLEDPSPDYAWLAHTWANDGSAVLGIKETFDRRLSLVSVPINGSRPRVIADMGPSPVVNNPVKGLSLSPDGRTLLTSIARLRGDLWMLSGIPTKIP